MHDPRGPAGGAAEQAKSGRHSGERCFHFSFPCLGLKCVKNIMLCQNDVEILEKYHLEETGKSRSRKVLIQA